MTAQELINRLRMEKIPIEGAWFSLTYTSPDRIPVGGLPARYRASRPAATAIYGLVTRNEFSALHRLKTDEIWHYYAGVPLELLLLYPDGHTLVVTLGPDVLGGHHPQFTVHAGTWMGARPQSDTLEAYTLFGRTMSPGFDYADYEPGYRIELQKAYPAQTALIEKLTRTNMLERPLVAYPADTPLAP